ncbi:alpha/beta hydrolase [Actinomadura sp. GTD37]|uniref:alpha/beta hydrolase n=1 Tax=Actinomadura sp. GTD37 TaxID=1778030 RepID=UPI0035C20BFB
MNERPLAGLFTVVSLLLTALLLPAPRAAAAPAPAATGVAAAAAAALPPGMRLAGGARLREVRRAGHRTLDITIDSAALGGEGRARILLPRGHAGPRGRPWPVLYMLHGCCDGAGGWRQWTAYADVERLTARYGVLVVIPDGGTHGFYSDWWNGGRHGPPAWETFHLTELMGLVRDGLGGGPRRAVAGVSMGGFGALSYAARHRGMFRAAASYSGLTDTVSGAANVLAVLEGYGADPSGLWGDPVRQSGLWREHNPHDRVGALRGVRLFVSSGDGRPGPLDPPGRPADPLEGWVGPMNARFVEHARAAGVRVTADLYGAGTHGWAYWNREFTRSLPLLMSAVGARPA